MNDSRVVGFSLLLAVGLAGVVSVVTDSLAILGQTPIGLAIYLAVGIGLPQFVLARRTGSPLRLGLAALAIGGAALAVLGGAAMGSLTEEWRLGIVPILFLAVFGMLIGSIVREFRTGFRTRS
ncbi:hypothetical protein [Natronorubrum texcoconense]|uniref:Major facilitator superfamily (MFS) profile domain-containing protein n=1 Tax=Natronorubrum texcoconense TaxID=1095776 RepID=A0A1G8V8B4_9EURY|nr:hypothetical protein [Natronorubrum texcoconense]SDJ62097.1 hypothetical protein SAMN04515672_1210 [Natronorubrum texcoconense]